MRAHPTKHKRHPLHLTKIHADMILRNHFVANVRTTKRKQKNWRSEYC